MLEQWKIIWVFGGNAALATFSGLAGFALLNQRIRPDENVYPGLIFTLLFMGLIVSYAALVDLVDFKRKDYWKALFKGILPLSSLLIIVVVFSFSLGINDPLILAIMIFLAVAISIVGAFASFLSLSKNLRDLGFGVENAWTVGHIVGVGILPFGYGALVSLVGSGKLIGGADILLLFVGSTVVTLMLIPIASHKWIEQKAKGIVFSKEEVSAMVGSRVAELRTKRRGEDEAIDFVRSILSKYLWSVYTFPVCIIILFFVFGLNGLFLICSTVAYLVIVVGYFDYPKILFKQSKISCSTIVRVVAVFLIIGGIFFDTLIKSQVIGIINLVPEEFVSITLGSIGGFDIIASLFAIVGLSVAYLLPQPRFYKHRTVYLVVGLLIIAFLDLSGIALVVFRDMLKWFPDSNIQERILELLIFGLVIIIVMIAVLIVRAILLYLEKTWYQRVIES